MGQQRKSNSGPIRKLILLKIWGQIGEISLGNRPIKNNVMHVILNV
jgi:hypothetical protein